MTYMKEFVDIYSLYLYKKYYVSRFYEEEYIEKFADFEIQSKKNFYEYYVLDLKLEKMFIKNRFSGYEGLELDVKNVIFDGDMQDLTIQINNLVRRKKVSAKNSKKYSKMLGEKTLETIKMFVRKCHPDITEDSHSNEIWIEFIDRLESGKITFPKTFIAKVEDLTDAFEDKDFEYLLEDAKLRLKILENSYPYNLEKVLSSPGLENKLRELNMDVKKSKEALKKVSSAFLQISESTGLRS